MIKWKADAMKAWEKRNMIIANCGIICWQDLDLC